MSENVKISDLVELGTLQDADELPVVDSSANATKRVTYQTLSSAVLNDIDDLAELTSLAADDVLPVVDSSANATKRITGANLTNFPTQPTFGGNDVYHQGNVVGTVSQSGGTPTGAVVERDSNANGEYVKFADGTMICFASGQQAGTASGSINITLTYPASFFITSNNRRVATREIKTLVDFGGQAYDGTGDEAEAVGSTIPKVATRNTSSPFGDQTVLMIEGLQTNTSRYQDYAVAILGRWF